MGTQKQFNSINDTGSGIKSYDGYLNGNWILFEYDTKTRRITHNFSDGIVAEGANDLKVIVIDNVGNSTTFESQFLEVKIIIDIRLECQQNNLYFYLWISLPSLAQSARVKGVILDKNNQPIQNVNITVAGNRTQSNENGFISTH
jgi:hypothetical protein